MFVYLSGLGIHGFATIDGVFFCVPSQHYLVYEYIANTILVCFVYLSGLGIHGFAAIDGVFLLCFCICCFW